MNPEQIKQLIESGKLTPEDIKLFSPQEKAIFDKLQGESDKKQALSEMIPGLDQKVKESKAKGTYMDSPMPPPFLASAALKMLPSGAEAANIAKMLGIGSALHYGAKAVGLPPGIAEMATLGTSFGNFAKSGAAKAAAGAAEGAEVGAMTAAEEAAMKKDGFGGDLLDRIKSALQGRTSPGNGPTNVRKLGTKYAENDDVMDRVLNKGVQNDFKGRVSLRKAPEDIEKKIFGSAPKSPYPSNVTTESNTDDLKEMLTRSSSTGAPSPLKFHNDEDELRKAIELLKRQVRK